MKAITIILVVLSLVLLMSCESKSGRMVRERGTVKISNLAVVLTVNQQLGNKTAYKVKSIDRGIVKFISMSNTLGDYAVGDTIVVEN